MLDSLLQGVSPREQLKEWEKIRKVEATVFCDLIPGWTPIAGVVLVRSEFPDPGHTLGSRGSIQRWGPLAVHAEAAHNNALPQLEGKKLK